MTSGIYKRKKTQITRFCLFCNNKLLNSQEKFCSKSCNSKWNFKNNINYGMSGKKPWNKGNKKKLSDPIVCLCGCGKYTKHGNKHIQGHSSTRFKKGHINSQYAREAVSKALKDKSYEERYGIEKSKEIKQKIKTSNLGLKRSDKTKQNISLSLIGSQRHLGKKVDLIGRRNISNGHIGIKYTYSEEGRLARIEYGLKNSSAKTQFKSDLGHYVRSKWEANVCRILNLCKIKYEYESKICKFKLNKSTYVCDLYLPDFNIWIEVKGWLRVEAYNKLKEFITLYPKEAKNTMIIDKEVYPKLVKIFKDKIENWE